MHGGGVGTVGVLHDEMTRDEIFSHIYSFFHHISPCNSSLSYRISHPSTVSHPTFLEQGNNTEHNHRHLRTRTPHRDVTVSMYNAEESQAPLTHPNSSPPVRFYDFIRMTLLFSINHGCAVACLSFVVAELGTSVGNASSGSLYLGFMVTALFFSANLVTRVGAKQALFVGASLYSVYILSLAIAASTTGNVALIICIVGGIVGGSAAGILLTASGTYFSLSARDYTLITGCSIEQSTTKLSSYMAAILLASEVVLKLLASLIVSITNTWVVMVIVLLVLSTVSALGIMLTVITPNPSNASVVASSTAVLNENDSDGGFCKKKFDGAKQVIQGWYNDPRFLLAGGINVTFGFTSAYMNSYINGTVVKNKFGDGAIGAMAAITPAISGLTTVPIAWYSLKKDAKSPFVWAASVSAFFIAFFGLILPIETLSSLTILCLIYSFEGVLRCIFEGINKAIFADFFQKQPEVAFATIIVQSGGTSALAFILMSAGIQEGVIGGMALFCAVATVPLFLFAQRISVSEEKSSSIKSKMSGRYGKAMNVEETSKEWSNIVVE